ncbi:MAG: hypothetical protein PHS95_01475 [Candidatus Pacebacteria bacterium]|nr:hypothetical protein [Candidatus Paceibacterota bacterium]
MDRNSKYFLSFVGLVIVLLVGYKFKQFIIDKDFTLVANIPCDPATESCFRQDCETTCAEGDIECTECDTESGIVNADGSPYKKIELPYAKAPNCLIEENCTPDEASQICVAGDETCIITTCEPYVDEANPGNVEDGEVCAEAPKMEDGVITTIP